MAGSSSVRGAYTMTINGDTYTFAYAGGTLARIDFPDGRKTQWAFAAAAAGQSRLTLT